MAWLPGTTEVLGDPQNAAGCRADTRMHRTKAKPTSPARPSMPHIPWDGIRSVFWNGEAAPLEQFKGTIRFCRVLFLFVPLFCGIALYN